MSEIIKKFSDFQKLDEADGIWDFLGGLASSAGEGIVDVAQGKLVEFLYGFFGVDKESFLGVVLTNLAETIEISEYPQFMSGEINVAMLAPKLADATIETFADLGVNGTADKLGIKDRDGWVYRTIKEMVTNKARQNDFRESLVNLWTFILGGGTGSAAATKTPFKQGMGSNKNSFSFTPSEEKKISSDPKLKKAAEKSGLDMSDLLGALTGGIAPQGKGYITGQ